MAATKYGSKSSAIRGAKKAGLTEFEVLQVWEDGGKSHWEFAAKKDTVPVASPKPAPVDSAPKLVVEDYTNQPKATKSPEPPPAPVAKGTKTETKPSKSTVEKPTKAVWAIADEMKKANPKATRKEIVEECVRRGIAFYTARTQYQRWAKSKSTRTN